MKINPTGNTNFISGNYRAGKMDAYKKSQSPASLDEAALSEEAVSFSKIFAQVKDAANTRSAADMERIADIKAKVQDGTYYVDSEDIAESILGDLFG